MKDKFMQMLMAKKKAGKDLSPLEKDAKLKTVKQLSDLMGSEMSNGLKGMKKVTVAAPDAEGLKEGLETAEEFVEKAPEMEESAEESEEYAQEGFEEESEENEYAEMSEEDLDAKIAELIAQKEKLKA